jgi:hypothetical protein
MFQIEKDKLETVGFTTLHSAFQDGVSKDVVVLTEAENFKESVNYVMGAHKMGFLGRRKPDADQAARAVEFIKQSMDQQLGEGTGNQIFRQAGLEGKKVLNFGDLKKAGDE